MTENHNVVDLAAQLAEAMSADLGDIRPHDVLDWLASSGLTLRPDDGDTTVAYGPAEVAALGAVALAVGLIAYVCRRPFLLLSVDPDVAATSGFPVRRFENLLLGLVALAVVASFAVAGTLLVFGMLVAPAATGALVARRPATMMAVAAAVGGVSMYVGLLVSYHANLAAGASVVTVSVAAFLVTLVIRNWRWR